MKIVFQELYQTIKVHGPIDHCYLHSAAKRVAGQIINRFQSEQTPQDLESLIWRKEQMKTPIEILMEKVDWKETKLNMEHSDIPFATHEGILKIGKFNFRAYRLSNGKRVIQAEDVHGFFNGEDWDAGGVLSRSETKNQK